MELVLLTLELELEWSFVNTDGVGVELEWLTPGVAHLWSIIIRVARSSGF